MPHPQQSMRMVAYCIRIDLGRLGSISNSQEPQNRIAHDRFHALGLFGRVRNIRRNTGMSETLVVGILFGVSAYWDLNGVGSDDRYLIRHDGSTRPRGRERSEPTCWTQSYWPSIELRYLSQRPMDDKTADCQVTIFPGRLEDIEILGTLLVDDEATALSRKYCALEMNSI